MGEKTEIVKEAGEELAWIIAGELASLGPAPLSTLVTLSRFYRGVHKFGGETFDLPPNPRFVANGHGGSSPKTLKYLKSRSGLTLASGGMDTVSTLASGYTQVDVFGTGKAANAIGSTAIHMIQLKAIAARHKRSETITGWIDVVQKTKALKLGLRTTDLVGAVVPCGAVGLSTSIATAIARAGIKLTMGAVVARVSMELHWRAKVEMTLGTMHGSSGGAVGPASAVLFELFRRRGVTRIFGQHDITSIIQEPGGYLAVRDKMLLL